MCIDVCIDEGEHRYDENKRMLHAVPSCVCAHMHLHTYIHIHTYIFTCAYTHTYTYVNTYIYTCITHTTHTHIHPYYIIRTRHTRTCHVCTSRISLSCSANIMFLFISCSSFTPYCCIWRSKCCSAAAVMLCL
jgi:hypothetical protein